MGEVVRDYAWDIISTTGDRQHHEDTKPKPIKDCPCAQLFHAMLCCKYCKYHSKEFSPFS